MRIFLILLLLVMPLTLTGCNDPNADVETQLGDIENEAVWVTMKCRNCDNVVVMHLHADEIIPEGGIVPPLPNCGNCGECDWEAIDAGWGTPADVIPEESGDE